MFKPHTTEQGRVYLFLKERFMLEQCLVSPISCSALLLEDQNGCKFAFAYQENDVRQIEIPAPPDREEVQAFWKQFKALDPPPQLKSFDDHNLVAEPPQSTDISDGPKSTGRFVPPFSGSYDSGR